MRPATKVSLRASVLSVTFILSVLVPPFEAYVTKCVICSNYPSAYTDVPTNNNNQGDCLSNDASKMTRLVYPCKGLVDSFDDGPDMRCQVAMWTENGQPKVFRGCINIKEPSYGGSHVDGQCRNNPLLPIAGTPTCICNADGCNDYSGTKNVGGTIVGTGGSSALTQDKIDSSGNVVSAAGSASASASGSGSVLSSASGSGAASGAGSGSSSGGGTGGAGTGSAADSSSGSGGGDTGSDLSGDTNAVDVAAKAGTVNDAGSGSGTSGSTRQTIRSHTTALFCFVLLAVTLLVCSH